MCSDARPAPIEEFSDIIFIHALFRELHPLEFSLWSRIISVLIKKGGEKKNQLLTTAEMNFALSGFSLPKKILSKFFTH
jgi:hypothetical protein